MTDPLTTQLPPTGIVPPSKRLRLDSVGDGTDFFLEDLPDDLLVTSINLPALDGPSDLSGMTSLNSSQPQQLSGLNSTPSSQTQSLSSSVPPPMPAGGVLPSTSVPNSANPVVVSTSSSSTAQLLNSNSPRVGSNMTTSTAGAPPNTTVISTSADPTPVLPNVSSTSATTPYPPPHTPLSIAPGMAGSHPRMPSASSPYNTYVMTSSAPGINSAMQQQQIINYMGGGGASSLRHPGPSPNMGPVPGQMMPSRNMIVGQPAMMQQMRHRSMMPTVHGAPSMMTNPQHQQQMNIHHHTQLAMNRSGQQMPPGMNMGGAMIQPGHGPIHMQQPNIHMTAYDPRTRMLQTTLVHKPGMQPHRIQSPHHMHQHPGIHPGRQQIPGNMVISGGTHQYVDHSGYMRSGYPMGPGQNTLPPPSSQMMNQQHLPPNSPQNMPSQQQPPRPPSEGVVGQGSPIPGQLPGAPGPQLQVATPPQQHTPPPQQQTTPPQQQNTGVSPQLTQQATPTSRPTTPQQQQQSLQGHQLNAPSTPGSLQRGSPVGAASTSQSSTTLQGGPIPSPAPPHTQQVTPNTTPTQQQQQQQTPPNSQPQQQQTPPNSQPQQQTSQNPQTTPQPSQLLPTQSSGQQQPSTSLPLPISSPSNPMMSSTNDPLQYFGRGGGVPGMQNQHHQQIGSSPRGSGNFNSLGQGGGLGGGPGNQAATTDPEKRKLIQQQLVLLLHAHKCQRREREHSMGGGGDYQPCSLPHCQTMKRVLNHMTECQAGRQCSFAHCASSRQIITHWKNCQKPDCSVCLPLKNAALPRKREATQRPMMGGVLNTPYSQSPSGISSPSSSIQPSPRPLGPGGPMVSPNNNMIRPHPTPPMMLPSGVSRSPLDTLFDSDIAGMDMPNQSRVPFPVTIPNIPNQQTQPWHEMVQSELRQHLVRKLVETIFPIQNANALQDQRVSSLITYAMKVEKAMFETASSREEYYQLLAEKIYRIRKELEERRKIKIEMDKRRPVGEGLPSIDGNIPNGGDGMVLGGGQGYYQGNQRHFPSQSPFQPGHSNSPGNPSSVADGNPASLTSINDFLTSSEDKKEGILPPATSSSNVPAKLLSPSSVKPSTLPDGMDIKTEVKSPGSIRPPWSRQETPPITQPTTPSSDQKPIPSVPRALTPREPVSSVTSRGGGDNQPDSVPQSLPPSVPPSSRPATPSKQMDTTPISTTPSKYKVVPDPSLRKVFTRDELRDALLPVLDMVYHQGPEAVPFWEPVDPNALGIPDYFDVIKSPMDLRTIRNRLEGGDYTNPWEFCRNMRLMFDNAWLFNKKTSRVYKYCTKLVEVFDDNINLAMNKLGYCCGERHTFHPQVLYCYGKSLCTIVRDGIYYCYQNRYIYCQKCFSELPGDTVTVGDDHTNTSEISKALFKEKKNDHVDYEPMVKCIHCGREFHTICILHHPGIWSEGYQCDGCLKIKGTTRRENKFCAKRLPTNKLSSFLEDRVNMFLRNMDSGSEVIIRTVSSFDKVLDTRPLMRDRFQGDFPEQFPFRTKALFVFEEIDGCEVCFFGLHVQEYGSDCESPNTRRVYISYLDSIHFFHPKHLRTLVYHEILIGYLQFCKNNGFMMAHIWACPPSEGDDYIFHCHPAEQKIPKPKRLVEWYRKMLDRGKSDNVVYDYRDIFKHCTEDVVTSVTEIPYFEGDFWPNIIEDTIKELDQEAREREASEAATVEGRGTKKAGKRSTTKKGSKKAGGARSKSGKASSMMIRGDDLSQKIYTTMDKHKEVFFVVLLQPPAVCNSPIGCTTDPDQLIPCDLMDGRDAFLTMARERHWEFSSLRRAKASTQAMLYELHNQGANFIYSCNSCGRSVETRYHCRECEDFDLCLVCYETTKHEHPMEKLGLGIMDPEDQDTTAQDPQARKNASVQKMIEFLIHASKCRNPQCKIPNCIKIKRVLRHTRDCRLRATGQHCLICKQFLFIVYSHAKTCKETNCPVGLICKRVKQNIQDTQAQQRRRNNLLMQQRIRSMQGMIGSSSNGNSKPAGSPAPSNASPPTSKAPPPTPPQKGSPAIASPAGPRSVGKGGPRTPAGGGDVSGGKGAGSKMIGGASSVASKPERPMPAPNVTGETIIQRVPQHQSMMMVGQREHELANILLGGSMAEKEKVKQILQQDQELCRNVTNVYRQKQQQIKMEMSGGLPGDIASHQAPSPASFNSQRTMSMMTARPSQPYSQPHPQLMRAMAPTHYTSQIGGGYRTAYSQPVHHMVGPGQMYSQQSHHSPQLSRILTQRPQVQTYQTPPNAYSQMPPQHPQPVGPPPQYMGRVPQQPQTAGYPHMLAHHHPGQMQTHNPMAQTVGHAHQFANTAQPVQMDHCVPGDPNFVYNGTQQQTYPLNSNNSNNLSQAMYLTPADRLSTLSDLL